MCHHREQRHQPMECAQGKNAYNEPIAQVPMDTFSPTQHDSPVASPTRYLHPLQGFIHLMIYHRKLL